jgi:hypothetical protein
MTLSTAERRLLAALTATLLLALGLRLLPGVIRSLSALPDRVASQRTLLRETEAMLSGLPALEDSAATLRQALMSLAPRLLAGTTESDARSDLTARLTSLAAVNHGRLMRLEGLSDSTTAGRIRRLRSRALLETDFRGVAELLAAIERQAVILVPERIVVRRPEESGGAEQSERLEVELDLAGWYLPEAPQ